MKKPFTSQGKAQGAPDAASVFKESSSSTASTGSEEVMPLAEETMRVEKRESVSGTVRVRTVVDTVQELARANLQMESVEVTRVPVNEVVEKPPDIRTEGDVTIVPVFEEILVVEKRLLLREELHIRRHRSTEEVTVPVTVRKQRALVDRIDPDKTNPEE